MTAVRRNVFTVDLEDWHQGLEIDIDEWSRFTPRVERGLSVLLDLLDEADVRATFFVLGHQAERTPELIKDVAARPRDRVPRVDAPVRLQDRARRVPRGGPAFEGRARGHRRHSGPGVPGAVLLDHQRVAVGARHPPRGRVPLRLERLPGEELPLRDPRRAADRREARDPVRRRGLRDPAFGVPTAGRLGADQRGRLLPALPVLAVTRSLARRLRREGQPLVFYLHPWEYDVDHPRISMPRRAPQFTHYHNLRSTTPKTRQLLRDFEFTTLRDVYGEDIEALT